MNQKERFEQKFKENNLNQKTFIINLLQLMNKPIKVDDYDNIKPNYSKKISGEPDKDGKIRRFSNEEIPYVEEILHTSFSYLILGNEEKPTFYDKGIKYLAWKNDYDEFFNVDLTNKKFDSDRSILSETDEFGKNVLDYISEYNSINGLKFLVNNKKLTYKIRSKCLQGQNNIYCFNPTAIKRLILLILNEDDASLFEKFYCREEMLDQYIKENIFFENEILEGILNSNNIFKSLLVSFKMKQQGVRITFADTDDDYEYEGKYINPLLLKCIDYALEFNGKYDEKIKEACTFGLEYNNKLFEYLFENKVGKAQIFDSGYVGAYEHNPFGLAFKLNRIYTGQNEEVRETVTNIQNQLKSVDFENECIREFNSFGNKQIFIKDGMFIKEKSNNNDEYEALKLLEEYGYKKSPKLRFDIVENKDAFSELPGNKLIHSRFDEDEENMMKLISELKNINLIFRKNSKLNPGMVYVHGEINFNNVLFEDDQVTGIIGWSKTHIGSEAESIINVLFDWSNKYDILHLENENFLYLLLEALKVYEPSKEVLDNFYEQCIDALNNQLVSLYHDDNYPLNYRLISDRITWVKFNESNLRNLNELLNNN